MNAFAEKITEVEFTRPEPEPLMPDRGKQGEFPVAYLGPVMGRAVEGIARLAYVPTSLAAQSVIAACSLAVQPHFNVTLPTGQTRPVSIFLVSVAESGDRKSTSDAYAMEAVRDYERELELQFAARQADALIQQAAWDEAKKQATNVNKRNGREALEQAYRELGPRPEGPREPVIVIRSGTTQGLLKRFQTSRPSLGLMSDEGGSWLGGYGMSEDNRLNTISTLSDFWDGAPVQTLTSGEGHTVLRGKRLTFHIMVQPIVANRLLGDAEALGQGFLSRLLVSSPESLAGTRFVDPNERADPAALRAIGDLRERLFRIVKANIPVDLDTHVLKPETLRLDDAATTRWWEFYNWLEAKIGPDGDYHSVKGFVGKLPEMAARLAAILTAFEEGVRAEIIGERQMLAGIELAKFYLGEALRLFGKVNVSTALANAQLISTWLAEKWDEPFVSITVISSRGPSALRNRSDDIREALEVLERHNHVTNVADRGVIGGKKVRKAWRVHVRAA